VLDRGAELRALLRRAGMAVGGDGDSGRG
jgi:hypothetical protein